MTCDDQRTHIGMEYFCSVGDAIWSLTDDELTDLAIRELHGLSLTRGARVEGACVIRETEAYPVYDTAYKTSLAVIREYLAQFRNLQTIGRNGLHRYNNQDHSMMTGLLAARNLLGERHDLWDAHVDGPPAG
jgi:protoporphyrinogen oxidase